MNEATTAHWRTFSLGSILDMFFCKRWTCKNLVYTTASWWFQTFLVFSSLLGEMIQFDLYFSNEFILWVVPLPGIPVTTRIMISLIGDPNLNLHLPLSLTTQFILLLWTVRWGCLWKVRRRMLLVCCLLVFDIIFPDEETFANVISCKPGMVSPGLSHSGWISSRHHLFYSPQPNTLFSRQK